MPQFGILQERVAVEKDERDQVDTVKAHGKEANAADSDLQQLIAHEICRIEYQKKRYSSEHEDRV